MRSGYSGPCLGAPRGAARHLAQAVGSSPDGCARRICSRSELCDCPPCAGPVREGVWGDHARCREEVAALTAGRANRRVLVAVDIGVLSYAGQGRFEVYDAGALATPSLHGLTVQDQIARVQPAYVVGTGAETPVVGPFQPSN